MIYGFAVSELEALDVRLGLALAKRNVAVLDAVRHSPLFIAAEPEQQKRMEEAVLGAMDAHPMPLVRELAKEMTA